jgi:translocation and assembly module TamB
VAPRQLFVRSDNPRVDLELEADVTFELAGEGVFAEGSVEVIRGAVEPIGGRTFQVERGRVQFTGGPPTAALLDVQARYDNPAAQVTVTLTGPALEPEIRLASQPPMDDAQIAMLIATGRTDLKAGSGGVGTISGEEAGRAALSALATQVFKNLVADKLPLDTVALDAGALRAGKYVTDKIYVGYTRRFDASVENRENTDEVRVEYQITPRWTFESRYGNAQSGGASLIWSRDY